MTSTPEQIDMHIERLHIEPGDVVVVEMLSDVTPGICDAVRTALAAHLPPGTPVFIHDPRVMRLSVMPMAVPAVMQ